MKTLIPILAIYLLWSSFSAVADGLPYYSDGELTCEAIILRMNDAQFKDVDIRRTVVLTNAQRAFLASLFKTVPEKLTVVSSTFNDNREEGTNDEVHCIWLRDRMLVITYDADYAARQPEYYWDHAFFASAADPDRLVVSSDAKIYKDGKEVSVKEVYEMIDTLAAIAAKEKPGFYIDLRLSLPPQIKFGEETSEACKQLLHAFQVYGDSKGVVVAPTW